MAPNLIYTTNTYCFIKKNHLKIVEFLVEEYLQNNKGETTLLIESQHGSFSIIKYLCENGVNNKKIKSSNGQTAFHDSN